MRRGNDHAAAGEMRAHQVGEARLGGDVERRSRLVEQPDRALRREQAGDGQAAALYDYRAQAAHSVALVPESSGGYYLPIYGPQMSLLFAPLARLPYAWALLMWSVITTSIYVLCCAAFWKVAALVTYDGSFSIWKPMIESASWR